MYYNLKTRFFLILFNYVHRCVSSVNHTPFNMYVVVCKVMIANSREV